MKHWAGIAAALAALALGGCEKPSETIERRAADAEAFSGQMRALEKARGVEQLQAEQAEARRKEIEAAER